ncbi:feruloyl-CoA synthase [Roseibium aggregatum]|uniref:Feruloyl-CoA synthase n=1 Tax=Roseibium aggregatum TaxID=187304 RepID=A0A926NYP6_9HYPH|nr:feruloyl-CoA synthase [Roseibium aggregatum]MBD1546050.1 feruloyl-CoA synthase [Roseibium aggregatum]
MSTWSGRRSEPLFAPPSVVKTVEPSGAILLESSIPLPAYERCVGEWLVRWAEERPDTTFLAERDADGGWRKVSYSQALTRVLGLAGWLLSTSASPEHPVLVLSENTVEHALLALSAMHVGVPVATVSTAYSLLSHDHAKLKAMVELLDPSVIHVSDPDAYAGALDAIDDLHDAVILAGRAPEKTSRMVQLLDEADLPEASSAVSSAFHAIGPDTVARLLFTSGSTGTPKAVINTHRMLTSNQAANAAVWTFLEKNPPVIVDWLPWSHTFGANFTSNTVLRNGGSLYIDTGKPAPGLIERTIANFKDVKPTISFNVPRGYDLMAQALETDAELREVFFNMDLVMNAAAALPTTVWENLKRLSRNTIGREIPIVGSWGSTETAPLATHCHFQVENIANIGLPVPGVILKLIPNGDKLEVRVKGPGVTPGYYRHPELTASAFDEEGFYIIGDAVRFADPDDPSKGLFFDGRVSEDFKLASGTWVSVGELRVAGIDALVPLVQDVVVSGHGRDEIGFLLIPNEAACRACAGLSADAPLAEVLASDAVRDKIAEGLHGLKAQGGGSSRYATRARFLLAPPNPDAGEITDKAYLNQRQMIANRADDIEALFGDRPEDFIDLKRAEVPAA